MQLVALHGYPFDRRVFGPLVDVYRRRQAGRHLSVFAPDFRGRGSSRRTVEAVHTLALLADDVADDIMVLVPDNEKFTVLGLSAGGFVALEFMKRHRARFKERIAGLVLVSTRPAAFGERDRFEWNAAAEGIKRDGMQFEVDRLGPKLLGRLSQDTSLEELARNMIAETPPQVARADLAGLMSREEGVAVLAAFDKPILVVRGEEDELVAEQDVWSTVEAAVGSPSAKALTVPGAAHLVPLERPLELAEAIAAMLRDA